MKFYDTDSLIDRIDELCSLRGAQGSLFETIFIAIPDMAAWRSIITQLRLRCENEVRISTLPASANRLPAPATILRRVENFPGNVLITPLGAMLQMTSCPGRTALLTRLGSMRHPRGHIFVPLLAPLACADSFAAVWGERAGYLALDVAPSLPAVCFFDPCLPAGDALPLSGWLAALESAVIPARMNVSVHAPLRFSGGGARVIGSHYALLAMRFSGLSFIVDERTLDPGQWQSLYNSLADTFPDTSTDAATAFSRCMKLENTLSRKDPLRLAAWLMRLHGSASGAYLRQLMRVAPYYSCINEAVALELLAGFAAAPRADGPAPLSPEAMSAEEWLDVRAERADMLRALNVSAMPAEYWKLLDAVPVRRKLLYSSLCTEDERAYCREYLLNVYHLTPMQLANRRDVRLLYPELLAPSQKP